MRCNESPGTCYFWAGHEKAGSIVSGHGKDYYGKEENSPSHATAILGTSTGAFLVLYLLRRPTVNEVCFFPF